MYILYVLFTKFLSIALLAIFCIFQYTNFTTSAKCGHFVDFFSPMFPLKFFQLQIEKQQDGNLYIVTFGFFLHIWLTNNEFINTENS